ncbi:MAG: aminoacyl-tRNA hydrolase [Armatimonadetes bacterium]|nr:aminoacyl-tRNA hydrolase [Armatimonadota bacterium]
MFRRKPPEPTLPPQWLICGLGNPGAEYAGTRHNVGFEVIDILAERHKIKLGTRKHTAIYGIGAIDGVWVVLAKPLTFMNLSGRAVAPLLRDYKLSPENLVVVADELDLACGDVKYTPKGSAGGHNGHKSLINSLQTQDYARLKVGIGKGSDDTISHVLSRFRPDEKKEILDALELCADAIERTVTEDVDRAIAWVNTQRKKN